LFDSNLEVSWLIFTHDLQNHNGQSLWLFVKASLSEISYLIPGCFGVYPAYGSRTTYGASANGYGSGYQAG
jgi:hypothetical protein